MSELLLINLLLPESNGDGNHLDWFRELMNDRASKPRADLVGCLEAPVRSDLNLSSAQRVSKLDLELANSLGSNVDPLAEESQQLRQAEFKGQMLGKTLDYQLPKEMTPGFVLPILFIYFCLEAEAAFLPVPSGSVAAC